MPSTQRKIRISHIAPSSEIYGQNQLKSPLLRLPPELRTLIYEYVLGGDNLIIVGHQPPKFSQQTINGHSRSVEVVRGGFYCDVYPPSSSFGVSSNDEYHAFPVAGQSKGFTLLSLVCRQLYTETSALVFTMNYWAFANDAVLNRFVKEKRLSPLQRRAFSRLLSIAWGFPAKAAITYFTGLKSIESLSLTPTGFKLDRYRLDLATNTWHKN